MSYKHGEIMNAKLQEQIREVLKNTHTCPFQYPDSNGCEYLKNCTCDLPKFYDEKGKPVYQDCIHIKEGEV